MQDDQKLSEGRFRVTPDSTALKIHAEGDCVMRKIFIALFFLVLMASNLYAAQSMITESEGYACMGKDKTRKQTEAAAMTAAKYNAAAQVLPRIYDKKKAADFSYKTLVGNASVDTSVDVIQQIQGDWYNDASAGDCYKVKIKAEVIPNIKTTGVAAPISSDAPLEIQKQEAFIAAFLDGIRGIAEIVADIEKRTISKGDDKKILTIVHERIGEFEIYSQTNVEDYDVKADFIDVNYRGQKFVVFNFVLMYPEVELTKFIKWNNPPKTISDIRIEDVKWLKDGACEVVLSYLYKTKKAKAAAP